MAKFLEEEEYNIPRVHASDLSYDEFIEQYQIPNKPVIIEGLSDDWPAMQKWTFKQLYQDYGDVEFEIGEDEIGTPVKVSMKDYIQYMVLNDDDSPMYLFQRDIHKVPAMTKLLEDYKVPDYFKVDYQQIIDEKYKPNYNWFLVGPRRSGSYIHYDPFGMSAWNTCLEGNKRWILLEPGVDKNIANGEEYRSQGDLDNFDAINHILKIYPKLKEAGLVKKKYEFIQKRGDTIFLPSRWWHVVLNVDDTIAITQNFTNEGNFERVWKSFRRTKKRSACNWLRNMKIKNKTLFERAKSKFLSGNSYWFIEMNKVDNFKMYDEYLSQDQPWPMSPASSQTESSDELSDFDFDYS